MKKGDITDSDLRPEYDLKRLRVRKFGPAREHFPTHGVVLDDDVAEQFPDSVAVNQALRTLIRTTNEHKSQSSADVSSH